MSPVVCLHLPRLALSVAVGQRRDLLSGPIALAPSSTTAAQQLGECSPAAMAQGVRSGMNLTEALACCPELVLVPPDPVAVADRWEQLLLALEAIGIEIDVGGSEVQLAPGTAWFLAAGVQRLYGGTLDGVFAAVQASVGEAVRLGAAPTRFYALLATRCASARKPRVVGDIGELAREPISELVSYPSYAELALLLERLGISSIGDFAALDRGVVGERFGKHGLAAHDICCGVPSKLRTRSHSELIEVAMELGEANSGQQLQQALGVLVDKVLAHPRRHPRPLRSLLIQAKLVGKGTWQDQVIFREAIADPLRIKLALTARIDLLPAPAEALQLRASDFGTSAANPSSFLDLDRQHRQDRLSEAVRQLRQVAGPEGALRVVELDPNSRIPERMMALTPFEPGAS